MLICSTSEPLRESLSPHRGMCFLQKSSGPIPHLTRMLQALASPKPRGLFIMTFRLGVHHDCTYANTVVSFTGLARLYLP